MQQEPQGGGAANTASAEVGMEVEAVGGGGEWCRGKLLRQVLGAAAPGDTWIVAFENGDSGDVQLSIWPGVRLGSDPNVRVLAPPQEPAPPVPPQEILQPPPEQAVGKKRGRESGAGGKAAGEDGDEGGHTGSEPEGAEGGEGGGTGGAKGKAQAAGAKAGGAKAPRRLKRKGKVGEEGEEGEEKESTGSEGEGGGSGGPRTQKARKYACDVNPKPPTLNTEH
ncbi:hypothetical protein T484DRAFT_2340544 [Baffinella frigidus]|nr:hypothetical protein T484DRAFT_2340544 [Cryptophyta sp. CCMP2293]